MDRGIRSLFTFVAGVALVVGACATNGAASTLTPAASAADLTSPTASPALGEVTQTPSPAPTPSGTPTPPPTDIPLTDPTPTPTPTATPVATPSAEPTPTPTPAPPAVPTSAASWTAPRAVGSATQCQNVSAQIDASGGYHIAAECNESIHYYASKPGGTWISRVFLLPAHRAELDPIVAVDGDVVYVAYTRIAPDGGCGSAGPDVGVYVRSRKLPNGAWSAARKIGAVADSLQAFQVSGGTLHVIADATDEHVYYETLTGSTFHRYLLSGARDRAALDIAPDGHARIVYETWAGLRYAVFNGSRFTTSRIAGTKDSDWAPDLVLDGLGKPHVLWTRSPLPGGCAIRDPLPDDGTYYASDPSGTWVSRRISKSTGQTSLQFDDATGRAYALVTDGRGIRFLTMTAAGQWSGVNVVSTSGASAPVLRRDPVTGAFLIVYVNVSPTGAFRVYALTKPGSAVAY